MIDFLSNDTKKSVTLYQVRCFTCNVVLLFVRPKARFSSTVNTQQPQRFITTEKGNILAILDSKFGIF